MLSHTIKSHVEALGLYNFIRGFGWVYKWGGGPISGDEYKQNKQNFQSHKIKDV